MLSCVWHGVCRHRTLMSLPMLNSDLSLMSVLVPGEWEPPYAVIEEVVGALASWRSGEGSEYWLNCAWNETYELLVAAYEPRCFC